MAKRIVLGVHVDNRVQEIPDVQRVLTDFGCFIKTRIGLHQVLDSGCSPSGLLILEMFGDESGINEMASILDGMEGVTVKRMEFEE